MASGETITDRTPLIDVYLPTRPTDSCALSILMHAVEDVEHGKGHPLVRQEIVNSIALIQLTHPQESRADGQSDTQDSFLGRTVTAVQSRLGRVADWDASGLFAEAAELPPSETLDYWVKRYSEFVHYHIDGLNPTSWPVHRDLANLSAVEDSAQIGRICKETAGDIAIRTAQKEFVSFVLDNDTLRLMTKFFEEGRFAVTLGFSHSLTSEFAVNQYADMLIVDFKDLNIGALISGDRVSSGANELLRLIIEICPEPVVNSFIRKFRDHNGKF